MRLCARLAALILAMIVAGPAEAALTGPVRATVVRVIDGDTLVVEADVWLDLRITARVRIRGIDTPEINGRCADERLKALNARAFVQQHLADGQVILRDVAYGKFAGRVIADVTTAEGADIARLLLDAGLARPYAGRRRESWCG